MLRVSTACVFALCKVLLIIGAPLEAWQQQQQQPLPFSTSPCIWLLMLRTQWRISHSMTLLCVKSLAITANLF